MTDMRATERKVTFGQWERDPDHSHVLRRRRYETWIENGQKVGSWTWDLDV